MVSVSGRSAGDGRSGRAARGQYAKTAARRQAILEAAAEAFRESGYVSASLRDIADRLGMSHANLRFHFQNKEALLAAVLEHQERGFADVLDRAAESPLEFLAFALDLFEGRESIPGVTELFLTLGAESGSVDHPGHEYMVWRYRRLRNVVEDVFDALREQGLLRAQVDSPRIARYVIALLDGLQLQWLYARADIDVRADLAAYFAQVLNARGRRHLERLTTAPVWSRPV
jgi:AcrR family transcriptional regulator